MPFFSIIVPTYNRAHLIVQTLQSILNQDFTDFEILIIDDGSTDDTEEVVEINFPTQTKIHYIRKKNEERSIARNTGFMLAQGEYVVFFDSDDLMLPYYLTELEKAITKYPAGNFFATKYQIDTQGFISFNEITNLTEGFYDYRLLLKGNVFGTMVCVKKQNPDFQFFPPEFNMCEDWIFNMLNLKNDRIYLIDKVGITIINHHSRSMANNEKAIKGRLSAMDFIKQNLQFSTQEIKQLEGHTYQFCAVHFYIDGNKGKAIHFWLKTIVKLGIDTSLLTLLLKILIGKRLIKKLQKTKQQK
jgi:GalNAc5-diNAcBac-PP-undecaprenol beta-1,3-glucosyltransferase